MADSFGRSNDGLFAGTAWHYARYRPGYPQAFFDDVARQFRLDGTGQLTLPLAQHVAEGSFHWMDRQQVLTVIDDMVDDDGGVVLANDSCLLRPTTAWQQAVEEIQHHFLPADFVLPDSLPGRVNAAVVDHQPHEEVLARSSFQHVHRRTYESARPWTIEQVIGYLYSTSLPLCRLLGNRRSTFEQAITDALLAIDPDGRFIEPVTLEVLAATKRAS